MSESEDLGFAMPRPARLPKWLLAIVALGIAAAAFVFGYLPRRHRHDDAAAAAAAAASGSADAGRPRVEVVTAKPVESGHALALAGTVQALEQTTVYPRGTGYVRTWKVDIGEHVIAGQLLAEIDLPETDDGLAQARAQLAQARAQLAQAKAARQFSQTNLTRYEGLSKGDVVAQVDVEQVKAQAANDEASVTAATANVGAASANVSRLVEQQSYGKVTAPFAGTVIERSIERGALVSAGTSTPLYTIASMDPVRVFVQVPQAAAVAVKPGVKATVTVRELAGRSFTGEVAHVAGALDPAARTMNTEIRIPNHDGALMSGMYVTASLDLTVPHQTLEIPATALWSDAQGTRVGVVGGDGVLHLVPIVIERDTGATLQIASGLHGDEKIVAIAGATLVDGEPVEAVEPPAPAPAPAAPALPAK